jgi:hypothetical protein
MTILTLRTISVRPTSTPKVSACEGIDDSSAITKRATIKRFLRATAWFAAGTILLAALDGAEARSGGSHQTLSNATATTSGTPSNYRPSQYFGCWGGGRCRAKLPPNPPRRPTIPNTNGPTKHVCGDPWRGLRC